MKILFLNSSVPNYLTDALFHGLKSIPGVLTVDMPRIDYMYSDATKEELERTGSRGNTLYKLISESKDVHGKRTFWQLDIPDYDYIFFTDIYKQCDLYHSIYKSMPVSKRNSLCIIDGYDSISIFPFFNNSYNLKVRPWSYLYNITNSNIFKREFESVAGLYGFSKQKHYFLNKLLSSFISKPKKLFPISMSIPEEHIQVVPFGEKLKDFINYNLDGELNDLFPQRPVAELGKWQPTFANQSEYFTEIKNSRFGITTKRAGWDCLRHYEYAAMGAILCFKDLDQKHHLCAPFELNETNCIPYKNKEDLLTKIKNKSIWELEQIQENQYSWINRYTTKNVAISLLDKLESLNYPKKVIMTDKSEFKKELLLNDE
jgi:hypothetical protein